MTIAAKIRDVLLEDWRSEIVLLLCPVRVVAIRTVGRIGIPLGVIDAMLTVVVQLDLFCVTHRAVNFATCSAHRFSVLVHVCVALDTSIASVGGIYQFVLVNIQRDYLTVCFLLEIGVRMAGHAERIRETLFIEDTPNLVRLVAIDATGYLMRFLLPEFTPNNLQMDLLDLGMTLHAGACDVVPVDR